MKKSYHSMVVPTALATATRRDSDVGLAGNVMYHRGAYHATRAAGLPSDSMRNAVARSDLSRLRSPCRSRVQSVFGIAAWKIVLAAAGAILFVKTGKKTMIHVENLVKTFGEVKAVDGVSFDVAKGEIFAFLGPNGAGKTTTIQMLTTLLRPTSGSMTLDGLDPGDAARSRSRRALRHRVSGSESRQRADGLREHGAARRALSRAAQGARSSASRCCSSCSSCGTARTRS